MSLQEEDINNEQKEPNLMNTGKCELKIKKNI